MTGEKGPGDKNSFADIRIYNYEKQGHHAIRKGGSCGYI